jgi:hypothetical protein
MLSGLASGSYVIQSKVSLFQTTSTTGLVNCNLDAGGANDRAEAMLVNVSDLQLTNHLTVTFASTGSATLSCLKESAGQTVGTNAARVTAIRVGSETSTAF